MPVDPLATSPGSVVDPSTDSGFGAFAAAVATVECLGALRPADREAAERTDDERDDRGRGEHRPRTRPHLERDAALPATADAGLPASTIVRRAASSAVTGAASRSSEVARSCRNALTSGRGGRSLIGHLGHLQGCMQTAQRALHVVAHRRDGAGQHRRRLRSASSRSRAPARRRPVAAARARRARRRARARPAARDGRRAAGARLRRLRMSSRRERRAALRTAVWPTRHR